MLDVHPRAEQEADQGGHDQTVEALVEGGDRPAVRMPGQVNQEQRAGRQSEDQGDAVDRPEAAQRNRMRDRAGDEDQGDQADHGVAAEQRKPRIGGEAEDRDGDGEELGPEEQEGVGTLHGRDNRVDAPPGSAE